MTRIPSIDGLRGIAALTVVVFHGFVSTFEAWPWWVNPGHLGVRLFFVLSGALISGLLWSMQEDGRTFGSTWRRFAYRRALRIFPLAYLAMALAWLAGLPAMREYPWAYLTFTNNTVPALDGDAGYGLGHLWTLAVEEQVYLGWPVLVLLVPFVRWPVVAIGLIVSAATLRAVVWAYAWPFDQLPFTYLDGFAAGSLVTWSVRDGQASACGRWLVLVGAGLVAATAWAGSSPTDAALETGTILLLAALVGWAWTHPDAPILSWRPLVWVGTISYGVYVWHLVAPVLLERLGVPLPAFGFARCAWMLTCGIGVAALTWYGFERPLNRLKDRRAAERSSRLPVTA